MEAEESASVFVVGYGASRRTERPEGYSERNRKLRYQRVAGLFEDHVGLVPTTYAAFQLHKRGRFEEARHLLNALLPSSVQLTGATDSSDDPLFDVAGVFLPLDALSDGFRTFLGWVWDLLLQLARVAPEGTPLADITGVVIVDEIDLFLHPKWQRAVVEQVATTFTKLQFLFSTHSPLVAGSLEPANIFTMDTDDDGAAVVKQYTEGIRGLSADQILSSSYFGLDTPRAPEMERRLKELSEKADAGDYHAAQEYLALLRQGV